MNNIHLSKNDHNAIDRLFEKAISYVEEARNRIQRSINFEMAQAYWNIGEEILLWQSNFYNCKFFLLEDYYFRSN